MRLCCCMLLSFLLTAPNASDGQMLDKSKITCRAFLASGQANMSALISWLRGYHAGKTGDIPSPLHDTSYGTRLGASCKQHPDANLIETSEKILTDMNHSI
jgi:hypothetical protein